MPRKCENWLIEFAKWTLPRSEAPETFVFWTGLFTLAAVVRRKIQVPKRLLGSWAAVPNLYILFIAPAGRARKSTTANYIEDLLDESTFNITRSPELITKEKLLDRLVKSDDSSMYIVSPEFGEFIAKSGPTMFGFLTNLYDGKKKIDEDTFSRGANFASKPCVNLLGATTPQWVAENMPESVIGGGFASRVIFVYEEKVRRRKLWYDDVDQKEMEDLRLNLVNDLAHINANIAGEFTPENDETKQYIADWYHRTAEGETDNHKLSGYYERRPAHVLKVVQLLRIAYSDELLITRADFDKAVEIVTQLETNLEIVFQGIGKNPYTVDMYRMLDYIILKGRVSKEAVRRHFMHAGEPNKINELMDGLADAGYVTLEVEGMDAWLKPSPALRIVK